MTNPNISSALSTLFEQWAKEPIQQIESLPLSGSNRQYFRLCGGGKTAIGVYNPDERENRAFLGFSRHFGDKNIRVPVIYAADLSEHIYLQQDLGDDTLFKQLQAARTANTFPDSIIPLYEKALEQVAFLQIKGSENFDYGLCYPKAKFDRQSILWDLNYFKYYFLKLVGTPFNEQDLEDDFHRFADVLLEGKNNYFMFRDFQSRNIMLHNNEVYFIDYQGGRKGALQYDVVSLLWQAKANLPYSLRKQLLNFYIKTASQYTPIDKKSFTEKYYAYALVRCLQVLGAYGLRGLFERKQHFITSIPFALKNLKWLLENASLPNLPILKKALYQMLETEKVQVFLSSPLQPKGSPSLSHPRESISAKQEKGKDSPSETEGKKSLTISIKSFSYKHGIPNDDSGNGGGFVFDCRAIHNPGRYEPYKKLTGRDQPVIDFLLEKSDIQQFLNHIFPIIENSVETYLSRNFTHLAVNFGCTGGQHRSVYSADTLAKHLQEKYSVNVVVEHVEQERKNWVN